MNLVSVLITTGAISIVNGNLIIDTLTSLVLSAGIDQYIPNLQKPFLFTTSRFGKDLLVYNRKQILHNGRAGNFPGVSYTTKNVRSWYNQS